MKKVYALVIALFVVNGAMGQSEQPCVPCLPVGIAFTTQTEIDNFQTNYPGCTEIEGNVTIQGNDITNLNGLNVLTAIGGAVYIADNFALTSLTGLNNLTSIGGGLGISFTALTSLTGLNALTSIGGELEISFTALTSLTGLNALTSIGGRLYIWVNNALTSLTGLNNLTSIGDHLIIQNNDELTSLMGLGNIDAGSISWLTINYTDHLSSCEVQSICDNLASPNGPIYINNNATGCNSQAEVEDACASIGVEDLNPETSLTIYPNPTSTTLNIETSAKGSLSILNISG
jgi:hypothetical protein